MKNFLHWLQDGDQDTEPLDASTETGRRALIALAEAAAAFAAQRFSRCGGESISASLACRAGCAACCHLPVQTSLAELLRIVEFCRESLSTEAFEALRNRAREAAEEYRRHDYQGPKQGVSIPCPLLANDHCTAYAVRPLACRGWNSLDVESCEAMFVSGYDTVTVPITQRMRMVFAATAQALNRGLERHGHSTPRALAPGLSELLNATWPPEPALPRA